MKKTIKAISSLLFALVISLSFSAIAYAEGSSVSYDSDAQKFIFSRGSTHSPTHLFENFIGIMPGDSIKQNIVVKNNVSNKVKVKIYLRSLGAKKGSEEFLSKLNLTVNQEGNSNMFSAPAHQTSGLTDWVCLGTFYSGAEINLDVKIEAPIYLGDDFQDAVGLLDWEFKAEEFPVEPEDPKPPQTGDKTKMWVLYSAISVVCIGSIVFLYRKKKISSFYSNK